MSWWYYFVNIMICWNKYSVFKQFEENYVRPLFLRINNLRGFMGGSDCLPLTSLLLIESWKLKLLSCYHNSKANCRRNGTTTIEDVQIGDSFMDFNKVKLLYVCENFDIVTPCIVSSCYCYRAPQTKLILVWQKSGMRKLSSSPILFFCF